MSRRRALYQHEIGQMKWFLIAGIVCCLMVLFLFNVCIIDEPHALGVESFNGSLTTVLKMVGIYAVLAVAFMTLFQYMDYHKRTRREFMGSLPFTQRERFIAKYVVGTGILTVVCAMFGIGVALFRSAYFYRYLKGYIAYGDYRLLWANDTAFQTFRTVLLLWVMMLTVYTIFTLVHSVVAQSVLAFFLALGSLFAPYCIFSEIIFFSDRIFGNTWLTESEGNSLRQILRALTGSAFNKSVEEFIGRAKLIDYLRTCCDYGPMLWVFLTLLVMLVVCFLLAYVTNLRQDGAKFGMLIAKRWARNFVSLAAAVCLPYGVTLIATMFLPIMTVTRNTMALGIVFLVIQIGLGVGTFIAGQKIFRRVTR